MDDPLQIVAMFDESTYQREMLRQGLWLSGHGLQPSTCCTWSGDPAEVRRQLAAAHAAVVLWDVSPVTTAACHTLERLLQARAFGGCGIVVTTTDARRLREYLGAGVSGVTIIQKPYDIDVLVDTLRRVSEARAFGGRERAPAGRLGYTAGHPGR